MPGGGKGPVDRVALWDDCDIKQQNYRSKPHKVWKVTKIDRITPFAWLLPAVWPGQGQQAIRTVLNHSIPIRSGVAQAGQELNHGNTRRD
jgi:hypothetical protein